MLKTTAIGNLGRDAEVRDVSAGTKVISFSIAHTEKYTDKSGSKKEHTTWVNCSYFRPEGKTAVAQYLKKGTPVYVEGMPAVRTYEKDGKTNASLELRVSDLQLLGGSSAGGSSEAGAASELPAVSETDDLPF